MTLRLGRFKVPVLSAEPWKVTINLILKILANGMIKLKLKSTHLFVHINKIAL